MQKSYSRFQSNGNHIVDRPTWWHGSVSKLLLFWIKNAVNFQIGIDICVVAQNELEWINDFEGPPLKFESGSFELIK